jgi:uncharacterized protein (DUF983 family)
VVVGVHRIDGQFGRRGISHGAEMITKCPRCGSTDVHGGKFTFPENVLREFGCRACGLDEFRRSDDADFAQWLQSWTRPGDGS